jgi:periplasmic copper chaperone A
MRLNEGSPTLVPMMRRKIAVLLTRTTCLCTLLLLVIPSNSYGQSQRKVSAGDLIIIDAWMPQPLQGARAGAIYLKIENIGNDADQLLAAESPVAQQMMVHESRESGGVMKMLPRSSLEIPTHGEVKLKPMGIHLMAMGLKSSIKESDVFPITLKFRRAGPVRVDVVVQPSNALKPTLP